MIKKNSCTNYSILFLAMFYITLGITCSILFFRYTYLDINFFHYKAKFSSTSLLYPFMFIISDLIVILSNRKISIIIALFSLLCEGFFAFSCGQLQYLTTPTLISSNELLLNNLVGSLGKELWSFFYYGLIASAIAAIGEIIIFSNFFSKIHKFTYSAMLSIAITLILHNTIKDYAILNLEPDAWKIIIDNTTIDISIMLIYISLLSIGIKLKMAIQIRMWNNK